MENLTWTGSLGTILNPALLVAAGLFALAVVLQILTSLVVEPYRAQTLPDGRLSRRGGAIGLIERAPQYLLWILILIVLGYLVGGIVAPYGAAGIVGAISKQFAPVWIALGCLFIYNVCIMLDSGALTAGVVSVAGEGDRGALLAVHSMVGFAGGSLGAPAVGMMLDLGGGGDRLDAWSGALLVMGLGSALVALIQWRAWRRHGFAV